MLGQTPRWWCVCMLLLSSVSGLAGAQAPVAWSAALLLGSDVVTRGLSENSSAPVAQALIHLHAPRRLSATVGLRTRDSSEEQPDRGARDGLESRYLLRWEPELAPNWQLQAQAGWYALHRQQRMLAYDYLETELALEYAGQWRLSWAYAPRYTDHTRDDALLRGPRHSLDLSLLQPLSSIWSWHAAAGYSDSQRVSEVRYGYYQLGLAARWREYLLVLDGFATDASARERFVDGRADSRVVLTAVRFFLPN